MRDLKLPLTQYSQIIFKSSSVTYEGRTVPFCFGVQSDQVAESIRFCFSILNYYFCFLKPFDLISVTEYIQRGV